MSLPRRELLLLAALVLSPSARSDELGDRFWEAAQRGDAAAVKALLAKGVPVNTQYRYGTTALHYAAQKGHLEVVRILVDHGADVDAKETEAAMTPLMFAVFKGHAEVARILVSKGAAPDTALAAAVLFGQVPTVKALLETKGLKPEALSSALDAAMQAGQTGIADLLRKAGAAPAAPASGFQPSPETLKGYAGAYRTEEGMEFTFAVKDGKLLGGNIFEEPATLKAVDPVTFRMPGFEESTIQFRIDGGKVAGFTWKQRTVNTVFRKVNP